MSIDTVIDQLETQLQTDPVWGVNIDYNNPIKPTSSLSESECPRTVVYIENSGDVETSTTSDLIDWAFHVKLIFWTGDKMDTKTEFKKYTELRNDFKTLFNNFIKGLDCDAWYSPNGALQDEYESIDDKHLTIDERFSITITEAR